jgi:ABC-type uncharacterized transport system involved in gliding motility auxiliary subunit
VALMTAPTTPKRRGSGGLIYTALYLAGMILLFIGERMVLERQGVRLALDLIGAGAVLAAILGRLVRRGKVKGEARAVELRLLACYLVGLLAVLVYLGQADFIMEKLKPRLGDAKAADRYQVVLATLWPTLWICSLFPLLFMEISYAAMDVDKTIELRRVRRSAASGLVLAMTICLVFALNYILSEYNKKVDLSYFKTTQASESSRKMVKNLSEPFKVTIFFPGANEVQELVETYFKSLKKESSHFQVRTVDHSMEPELAKELGVSDNGIVVMSRRKQNEQINIGTKLARAKTTLKKLDGDFQTSFRKLSQVQRVAYLTVGHEERTNEDRDKAPGSSIRDLRTLLQRMNYEVKELGIGQGLGTEVPKDATLVIIPGPRKEFLPGELAALKKYLRDGGHVFCLLDPEAGLDWAPLLGPFGLKYTPVRLANDRFNVRLRESASQADRHVVFSNRFSAHPSVSTLTRNSNQLATVMLGAGFLDEIPPTEITPQRPKVQFTIHSMPFTWNDENSNSEVDAPKEVRKIYELGAVVTQATGKPAPQVPGKKTEPPEMRLIVLADSDVISDAVLRNPGNAYTFIDAVKWLGGEEEYIGETTSEEDVRIMHTREKDQWWFYLTIFAMPALVLAAGLIYVSRRRKRS